MIRGNAELMLVEEGPEGGELVSAGGRFAREVVGHGHRHAQACGVRTNPRVEIEAERGERHQDHRSDRELDGGRAVGIAGEGAQAGACLPRPSSKRRARYAFDMDSARFRLATGDAHGDHRDRIGLDRVRAFGVVRGRALAVGGGVFRLGSRIG